MHLEVIDVISTNLQMIDVTKWHKNTFICPILDLNFSATHCSLEIALRDTWCKASFI